MQMPCSAPEASLLCRTTPGPLMATLKMPRPSPRVSSISLLAIKAFLWLTITAACTVFIWFTFARISDWYRTDVDLKYFIANTTILFPGDVPVLTGVVVRNGKNTTVNLGRDSVLMSGSTNFPLIVTLSSVLVAAAAAALLVGVERASEPTPPLAPGATSFLRAAYIRLRLVATWPLPARKFWNWFCGGLNLMEMLFAFTWLGLAVWYLYILTQRSFDNVSARLTPPPAPPKSIPLNATAQAAADNLVSLYFASRRLDSFGTVSGAALRPLVMTLFFPISRSSFLKWLLGTDFSTLVKYHRWMSWGMVWVMVLHSVVYMIIWGSEGELAQELDWETNADMAAGLIATVIGLFMAFTACAWFRQAYYNIFIHIHILGFITFTIFCFIHYTGYVYWIVPPLLLYGMDRSFRTWQLATSWTRLRPCDMHSDGSVVTLRLPMIKAARVRPGQTVYLYAPGLDWLQTHPFSVAGVEELAVPEGADAATTPSWAMIVHIKATGGRWTRALKQIAAAGKKSLLLQVEGPYDTSLDSPPMSPVVVMIGGGTGATPLLALLRAYAGLGPACYNLPPPATTYLLWTSRTLCELRMLGADLLAALSPLDPKGARKNIISVSIGSSSSEEVSTESNTVKDKGAAAAAAQASGQTPWLYGLLHYTGTEPCTDVPELKGVNQDAKKDGLVTDLGHGGGGDSNNALTMSASMRNPSFFSRSLSKHLSKNFSKMLGLTEEEDTVHSSNSKPPRPLDVHAISRPFVYAACVVLAAFGAYAGLITVGYINGYQARTTVEGLEYTKYATAQFFLVAIGTFFPPLACLALLAASRRALSWYNTRAAAGSSSSSASDAGTKAASGAPEMAMVRWPLVVGQGYRLLAPGAISKGDMGLSLSRGRPDVRGLLRRVRELHAGECVEIEVLVGGPPAMWEAVVDICCDLTFESWGPALRPRRVAHQH